MIRILILVSVVFSLGCSSLVYTVDPQRIDVKGGRNNGDTLDAVSALVDPYRDSVRQEMSEVIAQAEADFTVNRKPSGNLSNWVADAVFVNQTRNVRLSDPILCLLNTGGIRSSIPKGNVTIGELFKVMPFDNEVVWVRMPMEALSEVHRYILDKGGEPVSNALVTAEGININGRIERHTHFWVITSDYLMNGGDNMVFFAKGTDRNNTGKLIRDVLIEEARIQGVLNNDTTNRMLF